jgi:hypothetical protein
LPIKPTEPAWLILPTFSDCMRLMNAVGRKQILRLGLSAQGPVKKWHEAGHCSGNEARHFSLEALE